MIRLASEWKKLFIDFDEATKEFFELIYGEDQAELIEDRRSTLVMMLDTFIERYGDKEAVITRSPGRVNILGRHIEHRGGSINVMSIDRETLLICGKRDDDTVNMSNIDPKFSSSSFSIAETLHKSENENWIDYIESDEILKLVMETKGEWGNYVKASVLRLALEYKDNDFCGMDMLFCGNIPMAAGLSSSSSIVVATTEALVALNELNIRANDFVHLCGEGEWFVGSRGGAGDHAAMKCGNRDMITHLDFCPFRIGKSVDFPTDYNVVVANSFVEAKKSEGARDKFNQKVACYEFGFLMFRKNNPLVADKLQYLKHINPAHLSVNDADIYRMLLNVPEYMTLDEVYSELPEYKKEIDRILKTHNAPDRYEIRSTLLYGITECLRANVCIELLENKDYEALGRLMSISHDGDRVTKGKKAYDYSVSDEYLQTLINDYEAGDQSAALYKQPGGYACSTETIDALVDFAMSIDGVMGAELSGAGLGGCIIILVKKEATQHLLNQLKKYYYDKKSLPMGAQVYIPVAGSLAF